MCSQKLMVDGVDLSKFQGIPYNARNHPGNISVDEFLKNPMMGSNCQLFHLGILKYMDFKVNLDCSRLGSKELWEPNELSEPILVVDTEQPAAFIEYFIRLIRPMDTFFFWPPNVEFSGSSEDFKRLHIGSFLGVGTAGYCMPIFHNPKNEYSQIWDLGEFLNKGYQLFGVKRPIKNNATIA